MNIFEMLREDHLKLRELADALIETHGDSDSRQEIFAALKTELLAHAVAEERHFYAPLIQVDFTQGEARHAVAEHNEMDELVEALEATDWSSSAWLTKTKKLHELLLHHLEEQEQEFFGMANKVLDEREKINLANGFKNEKNRYYEMT